MARKKKQTDIEQPEQDNYDLSDFEDDTENNNNELINYYDNDIASNSMEYASIVSKPSELADNVKYLPREIRYSFFDSNEVADIKHWSKNYHNYKYLKKVFILQEEEDNNILKERAKLYKIKTEEDLRQYCEKTYNLISYNNIKNNDEKINMILDHVKQLKENGFYEDLINQNKAITKIYSNYRDTDKTKDYIDDLGMASQIITTAVSSMGRGGNERHSTIMSIQATKDIDIRKDQERKTDYKNKFGSFFNKLK